MSRKLPLLALLLIPLPAFASDGGNAGLIVGGAAAFVLLCAVLVAVKRDWGLAVGALFGIVVSGYLTAQHTSTAVSICNISSVWSCDAVNRSAYSEIAGVPVALFGVAFYAAMAWLALRHANGGAPKAPPMMTVLAGAAVMFDLYLAWASSQIGALCPLCVASWSLNVVLLVGALLAWRAVDTLSFGPLLASVTAEVGGVAVVGLVTLIVGGMAARDGGVVGGALGGAGSGAVQDLSRNYEQVGGRIELDGTEPSIGPADARFTIVEWADFECPHCAIMSEELKKVIAANADVRALYKHYPISETCNQFVQGERHKFACNAAAATECARLQGRFWELSRQMFKNQEFLGKEDIRFMVEQQGLDVTAFETCMADPSTAEAVKQDVAAGGIAGINGTPSVFVKGVFGDQWVRLIGGHEEMNAVLAAARSGATLPPPPPPSE